MNPPISSSTFFTNLLPLHGVPLVIGLTGPTKLFETEASLRQRIETVLNDFYGPVEAKRAGPIRWLMARIDTWQPINRMLRGKMFRHPIGLEKTPLMVLSCLAPGTDTIVVRIIRAWAAKRQIEVEVVAVLPFPPSVYPQVTSSLKSAEALQEFEAALAGSRYFIARRGAAEARLTDEKMAEELLQGCQGESEEAKAARNSRYRLAAGLVANYCDVLLALATNEEKQAAEQPEPFCPAAPQAGSPRLTVTSRCIAMKLHGTGTEGLPFMPAFTWADHGPVIRIPIQRTLPPGTTAEAGQPEVLYPTALGAENLAQGEGMLRRMCGELEAFNVACAQVGPEPTEDELAKVSAALRPFAGEKALPARPSLDEFKEAWLHLPLALQQIGILEMRRRRAATLEEPASRAEATMQRWLFTAIFFAGFFIHVYGHSHFPGSWLLLLAAMSMAFIVWVRYTVFTDSRQEQHADDWRAIAEGMRVQFFWAAAGLPHSVATNYLERMRSELDWLRNTLSAWSLPYARWQISFDALSPGERLQRLRAVRQAWVEGQRKWFAKEADKTDEEKHHAHRWGVGLVLAAIPVAFVLLGKDLGSIWRDHAEAGHGDPTHTLLVILLGLLLLTASTILARAEKGLLAEHKRQYRAMEGLMAAAGRRLDSLFAEAEAHLSEENAAAERRFDAVLAEAQRLFQEIGKQALDENAEWLLLHRSRPVEIPAGG